MALNYPGPYQCRFFYTAGTRPHVMQLNVALTADPSPGTFMDSITPISRDGTNPVDLEGACIGLIDLLKNNFNTTASFDRVELWKFEPLSFESSFVSSFNPGISGTNGVSAKTAAQQIYVWRTQEGGIMKIDLLDTVNSPALPMGFSDLSVGDQAMAAYIAGDTNVWLGRDTSYPFAFKSAFVGVSEAVFKKVYRP